MRTYGSVGSTVVLAALVLVLSLACRGDGSEAAPTDTAAPSTATALAVVTATAVQPKLQPFVVALSAGHGGPHNVGAVHRDAQGNVDLVEKDLNLDVTLRLDELLRAAGYETVLMRDGDYSLTDDSGPDFAANVRAESQARADKANVAGADIIIAMHFNGSDDPGQSGTSVYYNPDRSFGDKSEYLATSVYESLIDAFRQLGHDVRGGGVLDDGATAAGALTGSGHTFLLGENPGFRSTSMPGMIGEGLFVTNDEEAALLKRDDVRLAIAGGYKAGIDRYFAWLTSQDTRTN